MKTIWLVNPYGPIEGENWREYSFNQFGKFLSNNGFNVIWWTSSFSHHFKKYRSLGWKDIEVNKNYLIRLVPTTSYTKNFSIWRLFKDWIFAIKAFQRFNKEKQPDLIISADNPMTMGLPSYFYARNHNIPIVYDQMDIWPEFLVKNLPSFLRGFANFLLKPIYFIRKKTYENLSGSIALGKHYLEFMSEISPNLKEKPRALVYNGIDVSEFRLHLSKPINNKKIPSKKIDGEIWCIFAGTLGPSYDIKTIISVAKECESKNIKFFIAGSGPLLDEVVAAENSMSNFAYLGKLLPESLIPIYGLCDIGLATYSSGSNVDMPDKLYDYTAAGLAVVNSLTGEISEHINNSKIGVTYKAGDKDSLLEAILKVSDKDNVRTYKINSSLLGPSFDKNVQNMKLLDVINEII